MISGSFGLLFSDTSIYKFSISTVSDFFRFPYRVFNWLVETIESENGCRYDPPSWGRPGFVWDCDSMDHFPVIPIMFGDSEVVIEVGPDDYAEKSDGVIQILAERLNEDQSKF
jgi:hypothetical protein